MSDPGYSITRTLGKNFEERFVYPDDRCWSPTEGVDLAPDSPPISPETVAQFLTRKTLAYSVRGDLHGDGFPDIAGIVETGSHFLVVLNEGYLYVNRVKGKLDARFSQIGLSKRSHLLGVIPKNRSIQKIERIVARPRHSDEFGVISDIIVQGTIIYGGRQTMAEWIFRQVPCTEN